MKEGLEKKSLMDLYTKILKDNDQYYFQSINDKGEQDIDSFCKCIKITYGVNLMYNEASLLLHKFQIDTRISSLRIKG